MDTNTIRQKFLDFFKGKDHKVVRSSSLVPYDDPTLLFTSAGMNQFKKEFLGQVTDFRRAASSQRCLRTDDLDKVGITAAHHTFFEMLGNFSFGDYFKKEAIAWAWEFLINDLKIDPEALWVSVYSDDVEAYACWKDNIKFPINKIVKLGAKDNFWPANAVAEGPNGPCGPCSEIFFDYGMKVGCLRKDCKPGCNCGRFVEIWNLVFTQFDRNDNGSLKPLPNKNIDTGMGLERIASILQGKTSNFQIDLFIPIFESMEKFINTTNKIDITERSRNLNAIADHIRAITFAIYDGIIPSNEERGYVVRKIIRKAAFHGYNLGNEKPFLYKLIPSVAIAYKEPYPELYKAEDNIAGAVLSEEELFNQTLKDAPRILEDMNFTIHNSGHAAFTLHDTYGIPFEITKAWAKSKNIEIDESQYLSELKQQRERSKKSSKLKDGVFTQGPIIKDVPPTKFIGYDRNTSEATIMFILSGDSTSQNIKIGEKAQIVLNQTPFYGESGGQIGDRGKIYTENAVFDVENTIRLEKVILHQGVVKRGTFKKDDKVTAEIDRDFRLGVMRAHTATHMLQSALRQVLGDHVRQAGSLVASDSLRFDFTYIKQVSEDELSKIEQVVQESILSSLPVSIEELDLDKANQSGALAFFGEKYDEKVRVVTIEGYSKELCGGTHLKCSSDVGIFKIINESSIAKGTRRIEAITGKLAYNEMKENERLLKEVSTMLKTDADKLNDAIKMKLDEVAKLTKDNQRIFLDNVRLNYLAEIKKNDLILNTRIITSNISSANINNLRCVLDMFKEEALKYGRSFAICLGAGEISEDKAWLVIGLSDDLVKKGLDAVKIIKEIAPIIGGDGGGRTNMAQAGGIKKDHIDKALNRFKEVVENDIKSIS